jgi:hypothetical protein
MRGSAGLRSLAIAVAVVGCGDEARISASAVLPPPLAPQMLTVTVRDRDRVIEWNGATFHITPRMARPQPPRKISVSLVRTWRSGFASRT